MKPTPRDPESSQVEPDSRTGEPSAPAASSLTSFRGRTSCRESVKLSKARGYRQTLQHPPKNHSTPCTTGEKKKEGKRGYCKAEIKAPGYCCCIHAFVSVPRELPHRKEVSVLPHSAFLPP